MLTADTQRDSVFVTGDHHFNHGRIIELCARPVGDVHEMEDMLVDRWNAVVPPHGRVIHVGDLWLGGTKQFEDFDRTIKRLNGQIFLTKGNHDHLSRKWYNKAGVVVLGDTRGLYFLGRYIRISHRQPDYTRANAELNAYGTGSLWIHGHSHGLAPRIHPDVIDVGVDVQYRTDLNGKGIYTNFHPLKLVDLLEGLR